MKPNEIKSLILKAGYSQKRLAEDFGCSESQLSQTINGHQINHWIRLALAKKLARYLPSAGPLGVEAAERMLFGGSHHPQLVSEHKQAA
jgi:transcriptional regulator with XRE-family HTH domain